MTVVAIGLSVARTLRQIGAHPRVLSVKPRPDLSSEMFVADVEMDAGLPSRWRADGQSPNGVRAVEVVTAIFLRDFPATAPRFFLRKDFDRSHPHLQPVTLGLPEPCLLNGSTSELMRSQGVCALVDQLSLWLERAARLQLIDPTQGWEPVRRDLIDDIIVADPGALRAMVKATSGCGALWSNFLTGAIDERHLHRIAVDDEPAVIASDLSTAFEGRHAQQCLTLVAWSGKTPSGEPIVAGKYLPENIADIGGLLARAKELGCHEQLAAKLALVSMRLKGKRLPHVVPLGVILIARRPCDVIGQDSPLEICPYVVELTGGDDFSSTSNVPVRTASQRDRISKKLLARASGEARVAEPKNWVLFGCGSVGSKLALHLVRAGAGPTHVVDRSQMSPHNYARHGLVPRSPVDAGTLRPKPDLLAEAISRFGQDCTPVRADIATKLTTDRGLLATTGLAVNATGSLTVRESLCRQGFVRPQIAECCLTAAGRIGYMAIEGGSSNPSSSIP